MSLKLLKLRHYGFHALRFRVCMHITYESSLFSVMTGWIAEVLLMLFYAYTAV